MIRYIRESIAKRLSALSPCSPSLPVAGLPPATTSMSRLISCARCGRIHPANTCPRGAEKRGGYGRKKNTEANRFRSTWAWTQKAIAIKDRDHYLCQACLNNLDGTGIRYTADNLEVHHIRSLESDFDHRFDEDNLITLCRDHHEMAEDGRLSQESLIDLIKAKQ